MEVGNGDLDLVKGKPLKVFFHNAVPGVLGMLALSSAIIVDGYFLGNYVGVAALAAVNLIIPVTSFILGLGLMIGIGGGVVCGKHVGEGEEAKGNSVLTRTIIAVIGVTLLLSGFGLLLINYLISWLGANAELVPVVKDYLQVVLVFSVFLSGSICLTHFIRIDGKPLVASAAVIVGSLLNIFLDWYLVAELKFGMEGAAFATGISHMTTFMILLYFLIFRKTRVGFRFRNIEWGGFFSACFNGLSEFVNEISPGIVVMVFNWMLVARMGTAGVAAFSVINYFIFMELILIFGISESLQPIISTNFGAGENGRINSFLKIAVSNITIIGVLAILFLLGYSGFFIKIFIKNGNTETVIIAETFIKYLWPMFAFNGLNILFSSYFTSVHKAIPSALVALLKSLLLPVSFLFILPEFLGDKGLYLSFTISEILTFFVGSMLFLKFKPDKLFKAI